MTELEALKKAHWMLKRDYECSDTESFPYLKVIKKIAIMIKKREGKNDRL